MTPPMGEFFYLLHMLCCLYLTGLIWFVQLVHYPLLAQVGTNQHHRYHEAHTARTFWAAGGPMVAELGSGLAVLFFPETHHAIGWSLNLAMLAGIWGSTFLLQVPLHTALSQEASTATVRRLVRSNWWRTALWSLRAILLLAMLWARL
jgi:hypothetical protein